MTPTQNQQNEINEFIDGYGADTVKEYGQTFFEIISTLNRPCTPSAAFVLDVTEKLSSIYRLISALELKSDVITPGHNFLKQSDN